jgi:CRISPR-associated protein (TIGR02584 family)
MKAAEQTPALADPPRRRVLLAVTGLSPQVVTETLYALLHSTPQAMPREVHIITTAEGAERAKLALLSSNPGWLERFLDDFKLPAIHLPAHHIHVLQDRSGTPLADIRSAQDNVSAADQIAELVRRLTGDDVESLHVSLAGGRKTLGFFAGYALGLWGRPQDRLSHVLVSEPFEQSWDFFYPTPYERIIEARGGTLADCAQAEVTLADIPFVRLRGSLPSALLEGRTCFADAVQAAQAAIAPPHLVIDLSSQQVPAAGRQFTLAPADLAFLAWFARRASLQLAALPCPREENPVPEYGRAYLAEYLRIRGLMADDQRTRARYAHGMAKTDFEERKSKLKRALQRALGSSAEPYLVRGDGGRPMSYGLALPASAVEFRALPSERPVHRDGAAA